jgi:hypothetical protein
MSLRQGLSVKVWIWSDDLNEVVGIIAGCEGNEPKASGPYNRRRKN